jgi:hypothetical protein
MEDLGIEYKGPREDSHSLEDVQTGWPKRKRRGLSVETSGIICFLMLAPLLLLWIASYCGTDAPAPERSKSHAASYCGTDAPAPERGESHALISSTCMFVLPIEVIN